MEMIEKWSNDCSEMCKFLDVFLVLAEHIVVFQCKICCRSINRCGVIHLESIIFTGQEKAKHLVYNCGFHFKSK